LSAANDSSSESDQVPSSSSCKESDSSQSHHQCLSPAPDSVQHSSDYEIVEEDSSKKEEFLGRERNSERLCPCTSSTIDDVVFMTLTLGLRHGLSWQAQIDILQMIRSIYKDSKIPQSKTTYLKKLFPKKKDIQYHVFCDGCHSYAGKQSEDTSSKSVICNICSKSLLIRSPSNSFVTLSIKSQLENFLQDDKFVKNILTYRFNRATNSGALSDIYDGQVYRELSKDGGILSSPFNFSYSYFIDGVAFGKSNKTIWPIYLTINELPYEERSKYFILAAVYVNSKDPDQSYFLKPFVEEANLLSSEGISWNYKGKPVNSKIIPMCLIADSVARFQILNMQSFHAFYGCTFCYRRAESVRGGARFTVGPAAQLRTDDSWKKDLCEVYKLRVKSDPRDIVFRGVKGSCTLLHLYYFSITHVVVDYMHAILPGAVKSHMEFLIEACGSDHANQVWIGLDNIRMGKEHVVKTIDSRMKLIQRSTASRKKIQMLSAMTSWKASEFRSWLLFYAIPCLAGLLKEKYLAHLQLLSTALHMLLQRQIIVKDVEEAHRLLVMYGFYFQKYFGESNMLYNIHLLTHICTGVLNFGPIWGHNSFPYESHNRHLLQLCQSSSNVAYQICHKFMIFKLLPTLCEKMVTSKEALSFIQNVLNFKHLVMCVRSNDDKCLLHGSPQCHVLTANESFLISQCTSSGNFDKCFLYQKMTFKRKRYTTEAYAASNQNGKRFDTNDSYAFLASGQSVLLKQIVNIPVIQKVLCFVQKIKLSRRSIIKCDTQNVFIHQIESKGDHVFVKADDLDKPAFFIEGSSGTNYLAHIPYGCTIE